MDCHYTELIYVRCRSEPDGPFVLTLSCPDQYNGDCAAVCELFPTSIMQFHRSAQFLRRGQSRFFMRVMFLFPRTPWRLGV